jgi:hypothetical protein
MNPSRTTNRIHFEDLAPDRFEALCLGIMYSLRTWTDIRAYGQGGADGGVDIAATERLEDGRILRWAVQCRRYAKATAATLRKATDDVLGGLPERPDVLLVVLACDVSRKAHEEFERYAREQGVTQPMLWGASVLESRLHAERRDLLFAFFGRSLAGEARARESTIKRNIEIKRRIQRELIDHSVKYYEVAETPWARFTSGRVIIHSVDDTTYPRVDTDSPGISNWFRLEFFDLYHNGIEFRLTLIEVLVAEGGLWAIRNWRDDHEYPDLRHVNVWYLGRIPYRNIVEIDTIGDGIYPEPHLYCRFADAGMPYEEFRYVWSEDIFVKLKPELKREAKELRMPSGG